MVLTYILIAVLIVSLISLIGILTLNIRKDLLKKILRFLVAFSAGGLLATAFLELIPESFEALNTLIYVLGGVLFFFIMETFIHWHHHHNHQDCEHHPHPVVYLNLLGDGLHNFLDGVIIAASFLINIPTGITTTIAVALHEIPQEIGDYAVLVNGGLSRKKALLMNLLSASFAIIGGIAAFFTLTKIEGIIPYITSLAAGGFIYIAIADLFPELHKEKNTKKMVVQIISLVAGIALIALAITLFEGH